MRRIVVSYSLVVGLVAAAGVAHAQESVATVDPGMTKAQVVERLGQPATERSHGEHTYLFWQNGCERRCGTPDLVMLRGDSVIDAIFRSPQRRYSGTSSSPAQRTPETARRPGAGTLAVPAAPANDASTPQPVRADAAIRGDSAAAAATPAAASSRPAGQPAAQAATPARLTSATPATRPAPEPDVVPWPPAEALRTLPRADTIKGSPAANAARSDTAVATWPPPGATPAKEPAASAADSSRAAPAPSATWPPPRVNPPADSGAAPPKPPED